MIANSFSSLQRSNSAPKLSQILRCNSSRNDIIHEITHQSKAIIQATKFSLLNSSAETQIKLIIENLFELRAAPKMVIKLSAIKLLENQLSIELISKNSTQRIIFILRGQKLHLIKENQEDNTEQRLDITEMTHAPNANKLSRGSKPSKNMIWVFANRNLAGEIYSYLPPKEIVKSSRLNKTQYALIRKGYGGRALISNRLADQVVSEKNISIFTSLVNNPHFNLSSANNITVMPPHIAAVRTELIREACYITQLDLSELSGFNHLELICSALAQNKQVVKLTLEVTKLNLEQLALLIPYLHNVKILEVKWQDFDTEKTSEIAKLNQLISLNLNGNYIGPDGLLALANLTQLTELNLSNCGISNTRYIGIDKLSPQLTNLNLAGNRIGEAGARALTSLNQLQVLDLSYCWIGNTGVSHVPKLTQLVSLKIAGNYLSQMVINELRQLGIAELETESE